MAAIAVVLAAFAGEQAWRNSAKPAPPPPPPPQVTVSTPLQQTVVGTTGFLGQFSAVDTVELRAQVGGTLTAIAFRDGQIVKKGDPLFAIDPRPFQIRLDQAVAQLHTAQARSALAEAQLWRAQQLKQTEFGTVENVDQRAADQRSAQAAIDTAKAAIRDAQLDLEFSHVDGAVHRPHRRASRLGRQPGQRQPRRHRHHDAAGHDRLARSDPPRFRHERGGLPAYQQAHGGAAPQDDVAISLDGDGHFDRHGTLDFIDNAVNRSSGTIHARATVANPDLAITPGQFARLRVADRRAGAGPAGAGRRRSCRTSRARW